MLNKIINNDLCMFLLTGVLGIAGALMLAVILEVLLQTAKTYL